MNVNGKSFRSIWFDHEAQQVMIIDQRWLPHEFRVIPLVTQADFATAITQMRVRGAPLIGATAAYAMAMNTKDDPSDNAINRAWEYLHQTRPTAINLRWALDRCRDILLALPEPQRAAEALTLAHAIADEDVEINRNIGVHGLELIKAIAETKDHNEPVNILTHCNAGWLATVDFGTATSPMYHAQDAGVPVHIWVDETRPRNQGALTAWELGNHKVPHTYITDNAGGHLMQHGHIDMVLVGTDRTTAGGDVCNKIGTYLKALAAKDNGVPFYVALPSPTIDWRVNDGLKEIPIEERSGDEVSHLSGKADNSAIERVMITPQTTTTANPAFDVTPRHLVTGLVTERGVCSASPEALSAMFNDLIPAADNAIT